MPNVINSSNDIYCTPQPGMTNIPLEIYDPKVWGPACWQFLHTAAICYPSNPSDEYKVGMRNFLLGLGYTLPCEGCREECQKYMRNAYVQGHLDVAIQSRDNLFLLFWDLHNCVNKRNGGKLYSLEEAKQMYQKRYQCKSYFCGIEKYILLFVVILILYIVLNKKF